jgi:hypothetical protein
VRNEGEVQCSSQQQALGPLNKQVLPEKEKEKSSFLKLFKVPEKQQVVVVLFFFCPLSNSQGFF